MLNEQQKMYRNQLKTVNESLIFEFNLITDCFPAWIN